MKKQLAFTAILLSTLLSCTSEKTNSVSADTAEIDTSFISQVQKPIADSITTSIPVTTNSSSTSTPLKQQSGCDFDTAREKALEKITKLNLSFVGDEFPSEKSSEDCSIKFHFYVKKIKYDLDGNSYLGDKVLELKLNYRKIGENFEFVDGRLFEINSTRYQIID